MRPGEPSRTAFGAAVHRAVHQELEGGRIFRDPLAWRILGLDREGVLTSARATERTWMRLFIAVRHRFAEDGLAAAVERGTRQVVVLGAGLDTFAYRNPYDGVRVFEVDFPATGRWKAEQLRDAGIAVPADTVFVGCDFERDDFLDRIAAAGFDPARPAYFLWLGVVPYLSREAVVSTLARIGTIPGAEVTFDYPAPVTGLSRRGRRLRKAFEHRVAELGEPLTQPFDPGDMAALLRSAGFTEIEDLDRAEIAPRYLGLAPDAPGGGGHVVRARVGGS
ncbi:MAG TPA: SAM-dependent methyltransferase [Marmoricola sp.]